MGKLHLSQVYSTDIHCVHSENTAIDAGDQDSQ